MLSVVMLVSAQSERRYVITGSMTTDSLYTSAGTVKKLFLTRSVNGSQVTIDSATVKDKSFVFKGVAPETVDVAFITGFDNGSIQLFLEPGRLPSSPLTHASLWRHGRRELPITMSWPVSRSLTMTS